MNLLKWLSLTSMFLVGELWVLNAGAQVVINEVCSYNGDILEDEDGDEPDWIELFNAGTSPVNLQNYSLTGGDNEPWFFPAVTISPQQYLLVFASGKNRVSPNIHTNFKLSKEGENLRLMDPSGSNLDMIALPELQLDHSFGCMPDAATGSRGIFSAPSPAASNQSPGPFSGYTSDPVFSLAPGIYNGTRILEISASSNASIHYTLDGFIPGITSSNYTGALTLDSTTVVRVRAFSNLSTELPSRVISGSYILNYNQTLPVFSITTDPANLWDWNTGIYVMGPNASPNYPYYGANFWLDIEVPVEVEFFEEDGARKFSQPAGLSINGGTSNRSKPMKSLRLTNKNKYGEDAFKYRFFEQKPIDEFKIIVLRNSSGDFNKTHFRDGALHNLMIGKTNIDLSAYRPAAVFLNGIYHGVHNIREKISKYYLEENYNINGDRVDLLEEDSTVIEGDFGTFNAMHAFITGNDMSSHENFTTAAQLIDTESLCDYYIAETFLSNIDWPYNNLKVWRSWESGSKWRYILIDLDIALGNNGWAPADFDVLGRIMGTYGNFNRHVQIFKSLLNNQPFKAYFINRYADLVNTLFSSENMSGHIEETRLRLVEEMPLHFNVWGNDMAGWDQEIYQVAMPHIYNRPAFAMQQVNNVFNLSGIETVELEVWPPGAGTIRINTITPGPLPWKGDYFNGNPVTISVEPNSGFKFVKWDSEVIPLNDAYNRVIQVNPIIDNKFTAYFSTSGDPDQLMVYPNPSNGIVKAGCITNREGTGQLEVINAQGQKVFVRQAVQLQAGINKLDLDVATLTSGVYMLNLVTREGVKSARLVIL